MFGSAGSTIASPGQGNYAAANAFLDAFAHYRQAQGLPALTIGWGPWSVGMVEELKLEKIYAAARHRADHARGGRTESSTD